MKRYLVLLLALVLAVSSFTGCVNVPLPEFTPAIDISEPFVGFRAEKTKEVELEGYERISAEVFDTYESEYAAYGATVYYESLTQPEQRVYHIVQYAMDHSQPCIFIDDRLLVGIKENLEEILFCLALDHPLLEQNVNWQCWGVDYLIPNPNPFSKEPDEKLTGVILEIKEFTPAKLEKKKSAIMEAERILKELPATSSNEKKAEFLYRYLGTHVEYFNAGDWGEERDFLYDALVEGKSICDGFANAYSLLCNMAGIPCIEKQYTPGDADGDWEGHTWNAVYLDGAWYNVDATGASEVKDKYPTLMNFGFSDAYLEYPVDYEQRVPKCESNLIPPDVTVAKTSKAGSQVKSAWKTVKKTGRKYVVVIFAGGNPQKSVLQKIANSLRKDITYVSKVTRTGQAIYYIFPK